MSSRRLLNVVLAFTAALLIGAAIPLGAQDDNKWDSFKIDRSRGILRDAYEAVKKHYYDPQYHGLDWDARYRQYDEQIKSAGSLGHAFGMVAAFLDGLNDSHTFFRAPRRPYRLDYGYRMQIFGENCFITRVRPGTDAVGKIEPGYEIIAFDNRDVNRKSLWKINYYYNSFSPQEASAVDFIDLAGKERKLQIAAKMVPLKRVMDISGGGEGSDIWQMIREDENFDHLVRQRYIEKDGVMIWKMPEFFLSDGDVDHTFGIARKNKTLILDLRGNPGGAVDTLSRMVGNVFDHDITIASRVGRKELKPQKTKTRGSNTFTGKLIVLIDSESGSAAELFARVVQLEHRGTVIGDRSAGAVMESQGFSYSQGADVKFFYSFSVTDADLIMADGKSLEHEGVVPDERLLPTAKDLASGSDPVLARAMEIAGLSISPENAGKMFPFEWTPL
ncbi:MAG: S41 family peptidase [Candidatus Acidiferrales bacterium]